MMMTHVIHMSWHAYIVNLYVIALLLGHIYPNHFGSGLAGSNSGSMMIYMKNI